jgi:hypothetical protein
MKWRFSFIGVFAFLTLMLGNASAAPLWFVTYGDGSGGHLYSYEASDGSITDRGALQGDYWTDIAFGPDGTLYGLRWANQNGNASLFDISDPLNPSLLIGSTGHNLNSLGWVNGGLLAGSTNSKLFLLSDGSSGWSCDEKNGTFMSAGDIEKASDGTIYAAGWDKEFYSLDPGNDYTPVYLDDLGMYLYGLGFDRDTGQYYAFSNTGQLQTGNGDSNLYTVTVDQKGVTLTQILDLDVPLNDGIIGSDMVWGATTSPVPVPGAVWLLTSGLIGLAGLRRRAKG